jgi:hypothetical protein
MRVAILFFSFAILGCADQGRLSSQGWNYSVDTLRSQLDEGQKLANATLSLNGVRNAGHNPEDVTLLVDCPKGLGWELWLFLGEFANIRQPARYRIDNAEIVRMEGWHLENTDKFGFLKTTEDRAQEFMKSLRGAQRLLLEYEPIVGQPRLVTFNVTGLNEPLQQFEAACSQT